MDALAAEILLSLLAFGTGTAFAGAMFRGKRIEVEQTLDALDERRAPLAVGRRGPRGRPGRDVRGREGRQGRDGREGPPGRDA